MFGQKSVAECANTASEENGELFQETVDSASILFLVSFFFLSRFTQFSLVSYFNKVYQKPKTGSLHSLSGKCESFIDKSVSFSARCLL